MLLNVINIFINDVLNGTLNIESMDIHGRNILNLDPSQFMHIHAKMSSRNTVNHDKSWRDPQGAFIGVILLPIVGNAAEHATAVTVAAKGKMETWRVPKGEVQRSPQDLGATTEGGITKKIPTYHISMNIYEHIYQSVSIISLTCRFSI